jgi:hypothetical protein
MSPHVHRDVEECVSAVLSEIGPDIILGIPIGIGKPNHFVNSLFARRWQTGPLSSRSSLASAL